MKRSGASPDLVEVSAAHNQGLVVDRGRCRFRSGAGGRGGVVSGSAVGELLADAARVPVATASRSASCAARGALHPTPGGGFRIFSAPHPTPTTGPAPPAPHRWRPDPASAPAQAQRWPPGWPWLWPSSPTGAAPPDPAQSRVPRQSPQPSPPRYVLQVLRVIHVLRVAEVHPRGQPPARGWADHRPHRTRSTRTPPLPHGGVAAGRSVGRSVGRSR